MNSKNNPKMDEEVIEKKYKIKKFFRIIFNDMNSKEFIRIVQINKNHDTIVQYFNDIDNLVDYVTKNCFYYNTFFSLSTTDRQGGKEENLINRTVLAFDFDKKDNINLSANEITSRFKKINLWYHAIIDSGHGFHVYVCIEKTSELDKVAELQKAIGEKVGADLNAIKKTQILRVPYTYNLKDTYKKLVRIIFHFERKSIKRYDINNLLERYCNNKKDGIVAIETAISMNKLPICVENTLIHGSKKGNRNNALQNIVVCLRSKGLSFSDIRNIAKEYNEKCFPPMDNKELEYQIDYIYQNVKFFRCKKESEYCEIDKCRFNDNEPIFDKELSVIEFEKAICEDIRSKQTKFNGKERFKMLGKHLLILAIIKDNDNQINRTNLNAILDKSLSNQLTSKVVNELAEKGYIKIQKGNKRNKESDIYILNECKKNELTDITISYAIVRDVLEDKLSDSDLRTYITLRYFIKNGKSISHQIIADYIGLSRVRITQSINKLVEQRWIKVSGVTQNVNSNNFTNVYKVRF